ncbi:MAG TPA: ATP-dependent RNA helicase HrpA [Streptosporangiaceae bacterium]|jgi:ATP-dependent helicase HrpA|nr:ATP-dependent RNA helicase HrpA [Streptosporangiaceae bacterium]
MTATLAQLRARLPGLMLRDQRRLARRADRAASLREPVDRDRAVAALAGEVAAAEQRMQARRTSVPVITYPAELPVSQRKTELAAAIRDNQVVIIAGETGSGKTTQLPKICLELGRGISGQIGHTQPRRIAARTVADRIAAELKTELGAVVGYKVRFADTASDDTLIKVMTDGILLTEMQRDRLLLRYDTLIIDEAHERSLNIDFILGYLRQLLPRRPDLKVIITSATIDPERFSRHFAPAPIVEVSGRTYPVEVRYRPLADPDSEPGAEPRDQIQAIADAVTELRREGPGDVLVFLSGEREIRDTADALADEPDLEILPLYARLSAAEQYRVFQPHSGRRVVLATNVAETSLTVPGIRYVVDPGTARISRYSQRTKVQRLPIEPISQASASQRAGRCGRTSDGICIRLYSEEDFDSRPEFTEPEILRTNLASVLLRMAALDLGVIADFPFVDPPDARNVADGLRLLEELGAVRPGSRSDGAARLTDTGRKLAELPVDPRLGRMILQAGRNGCTREVLIITAALAIQDPRERPADARDAADAMHRRFAEPGSDFLALLTLWEYLREQQRQLSSSAFRRLCRREYLHFLRVREWQDVYSQLQQAARDVGLVAGRDRGSRPQPAAGTRRRRQAGSAARTADPVRAAGAAEPAGRYSADLADRVHQSLLAGLLSHIGMQDTERKAADRKAADRKAGDRNAADGGRRRGPAEFVGARGARFAIFPDSPQARKPPAWVMAAELVETSRLWARMVARIEPEWAEELAGDLVRRSYSEPRWDARRGAVMATEKVTLYGLPIVAARQVNYGSIDPAAARDEFIQHALVEGDWQTHHAFFAGNQRAREEAGELEHKARRRGLVADDAAVFDFYDQRIPKTVTSARHFDTWWKKTRPADPGLLDLSLADLAGPAADEFSPADYPEQWGPFPLSYEFSPGEPDDGVTADVPLKDLFDGNEADLGWQIPGLRQELVTELIRGLPKDLRRHFIPAPDTARAALAALGAPSGDLRDALSAELARLTGVRVPRSAWDVERLPAHLRVTYRVLDGDRVLATGKDLAELRRQLRPELTAVLAEAAAGLTRTGARSWDFGTLPRVFSSGQVRGYPALADTGDAVDVRIFGTEAEANASMRLGTRRLVLIAVPSGVRSIAGRLPMNAKMAMSRHPYAGAAAMLDDCAAAAADQVIEDAGGPAWDAEGFARLVAAARDGLAPATARVLDAVAQILSEAHEVEIRLTGANPVPAVAAALADMRAQFGRLIHPGFISEAGARRLPDLVRYLRGIVRRLDKLAGEQARDAERMAAVHRMTAAYEAMLAELPPADRDLPGPQSIRWLIEELRVNLFAQVLGTSGPVSEKRIMTAIDGLLTR